jgi:hypothetical protein
MPPDFPGTVTHHPKTRESAVMAKAIAVEALRTKFTEIGYSVPGKDPRVDRIRDHDCSAEPNKPFAISAIPKALIPHISLGKTDADAPVPFGRSKGRQSNDKMENDMTSKIFAIVAAAVVLASAGVASAQTRYQTRHAPYASPYYNQDTRNLRFGHANDKQFDPYAGTVFEGVAPY